MRNFLDFEKSVAELEGKIESLRHTEDGSDCVDINDEIARLQAKADRSLQSLYESLDPWQKVQVARHQDRPKFTDYTTTLFDDYTPLSGDRNFADDYALMGGIASFRGQSVMVIGQERGRDTESRVKHNFGMARPEGYRKAQRLMDMADRFNMPVITLVDTPGAYPGIGAEERGQSEAIARSIEKCFDISVPLVSVIIGEGGSGGAIALASADHIIMLEHSIYSVISPEGCASILWRDAGEAQTAAEALRLTAQDLQKLKIIDEIVPEPSGGAHRHRDVIMTAVGDKIHDAITSLSTITGGELRQRRRDKFIAMGSETL